MRFLNVPHHDNNILILFGLGVSAISLLGDTYAQNQKELKHYYHDIEHSGIALHKGLAMTEEDCLRRDVIKQLICNFKQCNT